MSIKSILKKEGIEEVELLDTLTINKIAKRISKKLANAFSGHDLTEADLFIQLSRLKMYTAKMPNDLSGAKYLWLNNSIYFKKGVEFSQIEEFATHECIHYLQEARDEKGNLLRLGLYDFASGGIKGMAINEAAVQLMAEKSNGNQSDKVKYYDIFLDTISPNYYPLQCALVNELAYFTGTYPLYHSTLYSDDIFKNALDTKLGKKAYNTIRDALDILMQKEENLNILTNELKEENNNRKVKKIEKTIEKSKADIADLFLKIQNYIIEKGFNQEFVAVKNMEELQKFKKRLYKFKDLIGYTIDYNFYNEFYIQTMTEFEKKKEYIEQYGEIVDGNIEKPRLDLTVTENKTSLIKRIMIKLGILREVGREVANEKQE